jgi:hypothetical protein
MARHFGVRGHDRAAVQHDRGGEMRAHEILDARGVGGVARVEPEAQPRADWQA